MQTEIVHREDETLQRSFQLRSSGRSGNGAISMPSSINDLASSLRGLSDDAPRFGFAMMDLARLIGKPLADILGVGCFTA
jgi:hypothetical protein